MSENSDSDEEEGPAQKKKSGKKALKDRIKEE
jgi:hypothetical protein